ncbi:MAG: hypothetical protein ACRDT5_22560, partial [Mycobacterium sp.]
MAVSALALALVAYLCLLAVWPSAADGLPTWVRWFGRPGSWQTVAVVVVVLTTLCVLSFRSHGAHRSGNVPIAVVVGLAATGAVLGLTSYWSCHDATHPAFFTPLTKTGALFTGDVEDLTLSGGGCPNPTPDALVVARLAALAAIVTGLG